MFGFIQTAPSVLSDDQKERYHEVYCGLCHALKKRYGQLSRFCLTYDLTFYILLCNSLEEPLEHRGSSVCVAHPGKRMAHAESRFTDYAADLSVALVYHKMVDDWNDDRRVGAKVVETGLSSAYAKARCIIPEQCDAIERSLAKISRIERDPESLPDDAAIEFGLLLGELFSWGQDVWAEQMRALGEFLGRFIYFMDAAVDLEDDREKGSYNPFCKVDSSPEGMRTLLGSLMGSASAVFEKLPLEQDLHLLRSILYSGVWQKFNETYPPAS